MKIGCPNCGQHYDVDASALDHYFRCPECNTLFRGINAKPVKLRKYKRKNKDNNADPELEKSLKILQEESGSPNEPVAESTFEQAAETTAASDTPPWDNDTILSPEPPEPNLNFQRWLLPGAGAVVIVLLLLLGATLLNLNARLRELRTLRTADAATLQQQQSELQKLQEHSANAQAAVVKMEAQLENLAQLCNRTAAKVGPIDTASRLAMIDEKLAVLDPKSDDANSLTARLGSCQSRIDALEKQLVATADTGKNAAIRFNTELLKLLGTPQARTTRTVLERIDFLEKLQSKDLSASSVPSALPRETILARLATLEIVLPGIVGQLESLKSEVSKLKWALGNQ